MTERINGSVLRILRSNSESSKKIRDSPIFYIKDSTKQPKNVNIRHLISQKSSENFHSVQKKSGKILEMLTETIGSISSDKNKRYIKKAPEIEPQTKVEFRLLFKKLQNISRSIKIKVSNKVNYDYKIWRTNNKKPKGKIFGLNSKFQKLGSDINS